MMLFSFNTYKIYIFAIITLFSTHSSGSVVISGTRVIYFADAREVTVKINNGGSSPVLLQSWIDNGDINAKPSAIRVPFILTPPINRVEPGKGQTLRISYTGGVLPIDKESVFWLNVLEVPVRKQAKTVENYLQMAFRSRIKLFYRPVGLQGNANDVANDIIWSSQNNKLRANNPTPYYASLLNLSVSGKKLDYAMVAPYSTITLDLPGNAGNTVTGSFVNDYGAVYTFNSFVK